MAGTVIRGAGGQGPKPQRTPDQVLGKAGIDAGEIEQVPPISRTLVQLDNVPQPVRRSLGNQPAEAPACQLSDRRKPGVSKMQKIRPFLWFDGEAEEAANFYTAIFKGSNIVSIMRYGDAGPGPKGSVMSVTFELNGQEFIALNGGPQFTFSPAISFFVTCETQEEVDELWDRLMEGGQPQQCGWLTDYGA